MCYHNQLASLYHMSAVICSNLHCNCEQTGELNLPVLFLSQTLIFYIQGTSVQFDCSFDECGSYEEQGTEWECMHIDSVTVLPDDSGTTDNIYSVDAENLNEVI